MVILIPPSDLENHLGGVQTLPSDFDKSKALRFKTLALYLSTFQREYPVPMLFIIEDWIAVCGPKSLNHGGLLVKPRQANTRRHICSNDVNLSGKERRP